MLVYSFDMGSTPKRMGKGPHFHEKSWSKMHADVDFAIYDRESDECDLFEENQLEFKDVI